MSFSFELEKSEGRALLRRKADAPSQKMGYSVPQASLTSTESNRKFLPDILKTFYESTKF